MHKVKSYNDVTLTAIMLLLNGFLHFTFHNVVVITSVPVVSPSLYAAATPVTPSLRH